MKSSKTNTTKQAKKTESEYVWTCDYCGKESDTKKRSDKHELSCEKNPSNNKFFYIYNGKQAFLVYWITTLLVFGTAIVISNRLPEPNILNYQPIFILFLVNILIGCIVFLEMLITSSKHDKRTPGVVKYSVVIALIYLFITSTVNVSAGYIAKKENDFKVEIKKINQPIPTETLTPTSTLVPKKTSTPKTNTSSNTNSGGVECIGPDGKQFNTSMDECKKLNESWGKQVDYMVNCSVHQDCGGGTRKLKLSECNNSTCCQLGSGWSFYTSKEKCKQDQSGLYSGSNNSDFKLKTPQGQKKTCRAEGSSDISTYLKLMTQSLKDYNETNVRSFLEQGVEYEKKYYEAIARYCTP